MSLRLQRESELRRNGTGSVPVSARRLTVLDEQLRIAATSSTVSNADAGPAWDNLPPLLQVRPPSCGLSSDTTEGEMGTELDIGKNSDLWFMPNESQPLPAGAFVRLS